jgi:aminoglycoside phosphotransferase (APT) family kinase protein
VLLVGTNPAPLGSLYLVSERLHGRALLQEVKRPDQLLAQPTRLPGLIGEALFQVPKLLGEVQARLHGLDAAALLDEVAKAGVDVARLGYPARLDHVASLIQEHDLSGLGPGLDWLRRHAPQPTSEVVCHGDLVFTNLFVDNGEVTGVFDWSCVAVADPAYDVAATLIRLESRIPGVPRALGPLFRAAQKRLARGYQRSYRRRRAIDTERVRYFDAFWTLYELTGSGVNLRQGARPVAEVEGRWLHPETIHFGVERFRARTGIELAPLQADGSSA